MTNKHKKKKRINKNNELQKEMKEEFNLAVISFLRTKQKWRDNQSI